MSKDSRIRTVRLVMKTYNWWKANGGNLSHFVRTKIEEEMLASHPLRHHTRFIDTAGICYPHTQGGYCGICWPAGIPSREEWGNYRQAVNRGYDTFAGTWHEYQDAVIHRMQQTQLTEFDLSNSDTPTERASLLRRFWAWLV